MNMISKIGLGGFLVSLVSCGYTAVDTSVGDSASLFAQTSVVKIEAVDTLTAIEQHYNGTVLSWQPDLGYAILGIADDKLGVAQALGLQTSSNRNEISSPINLAQGIQVHNAVQAGGTGVWSGGNGVWSGGNGVWSGGTYVVSISQNQAIWNKLGLKQKSQFPKLGAGIKIAVLDTGIDLNHPAFQGRLDRTNMWDYVGNDAIPQEEKGTNGANQGYGHGTNVAGILAQVAPKAIILPLRVLRPNGSGDTSTLVKAVDRAIASGAKIINLSLGGVATATMDAVIKRTEAAKVIVVTSSGNSNTQGITYPARYSSKYRNVASVGSLDLTDRRSSFSNFGVEQRFAVPGEQVYSAAPNNRQAYWTGTSQATPIMAGIFALIWAEAPTLDFGYLIGTLYNYSQNVGSANVSTPNAYKTIGSRPNIAQILQVAAEKFR